MINQKQLLVMLALGGVWAGLLMWRLVSTEEPARVPLVHVTGQSAHQTVKQGKTGASLRVDLDQLVASRTQREGTFATPKNIFSLARSGEPRTESSEPQLPVNRPLTTEEELSQQVTAADLAKLRYIGFFYLCSLRETGREIVFIVTYWILFIVVAGDLMIYRVL